MRRKARWVGKSLTDSKGKSGSFSADGALLDVISVVAALLPVCPAPRQARKHTILTGVAAVTLEKALSK